MCPFKNQGWEFSKYMCEIIPDGSTRGGSTFAPSSSMEVTHPRAAEAITVMDVPQPHPNGATDSSLGSSSSSTTSAKSKERAVTIAAYRPKPTMTATAVSMAPAVASSTGK